MSFFVFLHLDTKGNEMQESLNWRFFDTTWYWVILVFTLKVLSMATQQYCQQIDLHLIASRTVFMISIIFSLGELFVAIRLGAVGLIWQPGSPALT